LCTGAHVILQVFKSDLSARLSSRELQLQRLILRDNITVSAAQDMLAAQMPLSEKVAFADKVVDNSAGVIELEHQVAVLAASLRAKAGWSWRISWLLPPIGIIFAAWSLASRALLRYLGDRRANRPTAGKSRL
jgi:dephospho-CoA kinase